MNYIHDHVPFISVHDEPRIIKYVNELIKENEVPEFKIFTNEPKAKRDKRHKKYAREFKEAEQIREKMKKDSEENDLAKQIMRRQESRESSFNKLMSKLEEKYCNGEDESIAIDFGKTKGKKKTAANKKEAPIKSGRVSKTKK